MPDPLLLDFLFDVDVFDVLDGEDFVVLDVFVVVLDFVVVVFGFAVVVLGFVVVVLGFAVVVFDFGVVVFLGFALVGGFAFLGSFSASTALAFARGALTEIEFIAMRV